MRLSCKQLAEAWSIAVTKVTQAREPAFRKVAKAMLMYPAETAGEVAFYMETLIDERQGTPQNASFRASAADDSHTPRCPRCGGPDAAPLSERELRLRELMNEGRADRREIHPKRN